MVDKQSNPTAWALLCYELSDAQAHLAQLCREMQEQPDFGETEYRIGLAHVYAHLNRAWNRRCATDAELNQDSLNAWDSFPNDISPF